MDLETYRRSLDVSYRDLALLIERATSSVHRWCTGAARPSLDTAEEIERATGGEVTAAELRCYRAPVGDDEAAQ